MFLINFSTYCYTFSNFFPLFYMFISPLLSTLKSLFLYPFIFLYFWLFLFSSSYYKFTFLFPILHSFPTHNKLFLSPNFFFSFLVDSIFLASISTLGCWNFVLFGALLWVDVIKFCVFKFLSFLFSLNS